MPPSNRDKKNWTFPKDVQHFNELPLQSASLLLAGLAYGNKEYLDIWKKLPQERQSKEVDRTYPLKLR